MKRPLVHALAFFALGIAAGYFLEAGVWVFFVLCAVITGCLWVLYRWIGVVFLPLFAVAGFVAITLSVAPPDPNVEELARRNGEAVFAGRIVQLTTTRNGNQRATVVLSSVRHGGEVFESRARLTAVISEQSFTRYDLYRPDYAYSVPVYELANPEVVNGQYIVFTGTPRQLRRSRNPGGFNEFVFYRSRGIDYSVTPQILHAGEVRRTPLTVLDDFRGRIAQIYDAALPEREAGIARSIILGDRAGLERDVTELFRRAGIAHILTISGLHISIVALALEKLFRLALREKYAGVATLAIVGVYVAFTGFGLPAVRAFIMYFVLTLGRLIGRDRDLLTSISLAALILLALRPTQLFDIGFGFSFGAVYAIAIGGPACNSMIDRFADRLRPPYKHILQTNIVRNSVMTTIVITLFTLPLVVNTFSYFHPYSIVTNTLTVPTLFAA
ncbi:MAG: competence protein ComEC family protein, partial [Defluviitaleaceae bacterium]|nr:competence protein ComEC family protein [Defluviitaleaceae bacterium]